jgi:uncharacterized Ntn-hydrolase superfamily protein
MLPGSASATYSIVAVDTATGIIGSAGASCIAGSQIISDVIEGIGAVHTQAYYLPGNQDNAHDRMVEGLTPDSIVTWLEFNDVEGMPEFRQYGVVTPIGPGASAGFTGYATNNWKGHLTGPGYSIQGNILLSAEIIESMETAYLTTEGEMEDRLMAALEAANVPGADTRCMSCNKPSISAFVKVVHPGDDGTPYLYKVVNSTPCSINPMDGLWEQFNAWKEAKVGDADLSTIEVTPQIYFLASLSYSAEITVTPLNSSGDPPTDGADVTITNTGGGQISAVSDNGDGTFSATLTPPTIAGPDTIIATVIAGGQEVELNEKPVLHYFQCGDANGDDEINVGDAVYLINYVFKGGPAPPLLEAGDANCEGGVNIGDAVALISYIFKGGPPPCCP